jgi:hypothetical protein
MSLSLSGRFLPCFRLAHAADAAVDGELQYRLVTTCPPTVLNYYACTAIWHEHVCYDNVTPTPRGEFCLGIFNVNFIPTLTATGLTKDSLNIAAAPRKVFFCPLLFAKWNGYSLLVLTGLSKIAMRLL